MPDTRQRVLAAIDGTPRTGPALADELGITRAAVWNHIDALRDEGCEIDSTDDGYVLRSLAPYGPASLAYGLDCPAAIEYHDAIDSTNRRARELADAGEIDVAVVANEQRAGRGRLDRTWAAPPGGIYLSLVLEPALTPVEAPLLTMATAVAVVDAVAPTGVDPHIKWPNDVMLATREGERKLCGILTAVEGEADRLRWAVVGVGLNANVSPDRLPDGATSLQAACGRHVDRRGIVQRLLTGIYDALDAPSAVLPAWRERAGTLGRAVRVESNGQVIEGTAIDVDTPGVLLVDTGDDVVRVHAGDCDHLRPITAAD